MQSKILDEIIKNTSGKTKNQMKTLMQTILPRIALYKALQNFSSNRDELYIKIKKYMIDVVAAKKHSFTKKWKGFQAFIKFTAAYS